jgi:GDPmannose 4,6-dehydratase
MLNIKKKNNKLYLGNIYAKRDWGHAKDYVVAMWKMLKKKKAKDYVIATGKQYSVKTFVNLVAKELNIRIVWKGSGLNEKGFWGNKSIIEIDRRYFRPTEVNSLKGNAQLARKELKWKPKYNITALIKEMIKEDFNS